MIRTIEQLTCSQLQWIYLGLSGSFAGLALACLALAWGLTLAWEVLPVAVLEPNLRES